MLSLQEYKKGSVIKHSSTIQIKGKINLLQRKAWNVLLATAFDELLEKETFKIPVIKLLDYLNSKTKNVEYLKETLEALTKVNIKMNVLEKDKDNTKNVWSVSNLLSGCEIKGGICEFAFDPILKRKLHNPQMYARISLSMQNRFNSQYALALYELAVDYYIARQGKGQTPWISLEDFRGMMGIEEGEYKEFKILKRNVINRALKEINEKSDLLVTVEFARESRKIVALKFTVEENPDKEIIDISLLREEKIKSGIHPDQTSVFDFTGDEEKPTKDKKQTPTDPPEIQELKEKYSRLGISPENFYNYLQDKGQERLQDALTELELETKEKKKKGFTIDKPSIFLRGYVSGEYDMPHIQKHKEEERKEEQERQQREEEKRKEEEQKRQEKEQQKAIDEWIKENPEEYKNETKKYLEKLENENLFFYNMISNKAKKKEKDIVDFVMSSKALNPPVQGVVFQKYISPKT